METPEQFAEELRLYKRHVLFVGAGVACLVVAFAGRFFDPTLDASFWGTWLILSGAFEAIGGRIGLKCGRTVLSGWMGQSGDGGVGFGESYTTRGLEEMTPQARIDFAKRSGIFLIIAGVFEIALGFALLNHARF